MRVLVWQWGRRGAAPRFAALLAEAFGALPGVEGLLSLARDAEILCAPQAPRCDLLVPTYAGVAGLAWRWLIAPVWGARLARQFRALRPDLAICAMPGPLDPLAVTALHRIGVPVAVIVHDADAHPGDRVPLLLALQRRVIREADALVALTGHVADSLRAQGLVRPGVPLIPGTHPPFAFGVDTPPLRHGGPPRLLMFGRLLAYKGLDLLLDALRRLGPRADLELRVVGQGPRSAALDALDALPGVTVENRWVPEAEIGALIAWSDVVLLPYREASQSGVAAAALAAGRFVLATRVGGLAEQLRTEPRARLCDADAASLAAALRDLLDAPPVADDAAPPDAATAWRDLARHLMEALRPLAATGADRTRNTGS